MTAGRHTLSAPQSDGELGVAPSSRRSAVSAGLGRPLGMRRRSTGGSANRGNSTLPPAARTALFARAHSNPVQGQSVAASPIDSLYRRCHGTATHQSALFDAFRLLRQRLPHGATGCHTRRTVARNMVRLGVACADRPHPRAAVATSRMCASHDLLPSSGPLRTQRRRRPRSRAAPGVPGERDPGLAMRDASSRSRIDDFTPGAVHPTSNRGWG
jgi:hypothetical protein